MPDQEIIDYIKNSRAMGANDEAAIQKLRGVGHSEKDINEALAELTETKEVMMRRASAMVEDLVPHPERGLDPVRVLFKKTWRLYLDRFNAFTAIMAPPVFLSLVAAFITHAKVNSFIVSAVLFVSMGIVNLASSLALIYELRNKTGFAESYAYAFKNSVYFLWANVLSWLIVLGGFVLLIIPGIKYSLSFSFLPFTFVGENERGLSASLKSKEYVYGFWWRTFWRIIAVALIFIFIMVVIGSSINFLTSPRAVDLDNTRCVGVRCISAGAQNTAGGYLTFLVMLLLQFIYVPFLMAYLYLIYKNFTEIKPQLVSAPVSAKKDFYIFCAILGVIFTILYVFVWAMFVFSGQFLPAN